MNNEILCAGCFKKITTPQRFAEMMCDKCAVQSYFNGNIEGLIQTPAVFQNLKNIWKAAKLEQLCPASQKWRYNICEKCDSIMDHTCRITEDYSDITSLKSGWLSESIVTQRGPTFQYICRKCNHEQPASPPPNAPFQPL